MAGNRTNERLRPRGMRIRGRLLLLLAIPLTALLGITGYGVFYGATQWSGASKLQEWTDLYSFVDQGRVERWFRRMGLFLFPAK